MSVPKKRGKVVKSRRDEFAEIRARVDEVERENISLRERFNASLQFEREWALSNSIQSMRNAYEALAEVCYEASDTGSGIRLETPAQAVRRLRKEYDDMKAGA
jgi:hypothetical protein